MYYDYDDYYLLTSFDDYDNHDVRMMVGDRLKAIELINCTMEVDRYLLL